MSKLPGLTLIVIIIVLATLGVSVYLGLNKNSATQIDETATSSSTSPNTKPGFQVEYDKIKNRLPYQENGVKLEYKEDLGFMIAFIEGVSTKEEFLQKKHTTETYLKSQGVSDLCALEITWNPAATLTLTTTDKLSTGCQF